MKTPMPPGRSQFYNGSRNPCTMLIGRCSCGSTHTADRYHFKFPSFSEKRWMQLWEVASLKPGTKVTIDPFYDECEVNLDDNRCTGVVAFKCKSQAIEFCKLNNLSVVNKPDWKVADED